MSTNNNLISANNLSVNENLTVNNTIICGNVQSTGSISTTNNISANQATISELKSVSKINSVTAQNLQSLDTTTSLTYQLQQLNQNIRAYVDAQVALILNNPSVPIDSITEVLNYLNGSILQSINNKLDKTSDSQTIAGDYINFSGSFNSFENTFSTPDILLLDSDTQQSMSVKNTLNSKANIDDVVNLTENQTIAGSKTFLDDTNINSGLNVYGDAIFHQSMLVNNDLNLKDYNVYDKLTSFNQRCSADGSGNVRLRSTANNTSVTIGTNNENNIIIDSNGRTTISNDNGLNNIVLTVSDSESNSMIFVPQVAAGGYNFITKNGSAIFQNSASQSLTLGVRQNTSCTGININPSTILIGSGGTSATPNNYLFLNNGIGINTQNPSYPLDINGNMRANDFFFSNYTDPILQNNTASLSQRWTGLNAVLQNNIDETVVNTSNITTLQSQVSSLISNGIKAYGRWNGTSVAIGGQYVNQSQCFYGSFTLNGVSYNGTKIQLQSGISGVKGILQVTCDAVPNYFARFESLSNPFEFAVITFNPNGTVGNYPFFFTVI